MCSRISRPNLGVAPIPSRVVFHLWVSTRSNRGTQTFRLTNKKVRDSDGHNPNPKTNNVTVKLNEHEPVPHGLLHSGGRERVHNNASVHRSIRVIELHFGSVVPKQGDDKLYTAECVSSNMEGVSGSAHRWLAE